MKIDPSDRQLLMWAAVFVLPLIVALSLISGQDEVSDVPSTYSAQTHGAKAAYLLLQQDGYNVERWEQPPAQLPANPEHTVLVLASPLRAPAIDDRNALQAYVSKGGKILATGSAAAFYLPRAETEPEPLPASAWKDYPPQQLTLLTRGGTIKMSPAAYWKSTSTDFLTHYADEGRPIVVSYKVGRGEVIWWAASTPLSNAAIGKSGDLALLLNSLGEPGEVQVLWDEYFHGYGSAAGAYLGEKPIVFGLLQCLLIFIALVFTYSRRSGPVRPWSEASRLSPLEFVHTLGKLYRRAKAVHSALEIPYARFRMQATRQLGINVDIPAAELARALKSRLRYTNDALEELFMEIESALREPELTEARALALVQKLNQHSMNLKSISLGRQETTAHADSVPRAHARTN